MAELSIVVPVYQAEKYLVKCVRSILEQSYRNFELILVDDGSKDRCPEICDEFALKDQRIRVFHQKNGGSVAARKTGLNAAEGIYITFVDADDWMDADYLESMMMSVQNEQADAVISGYQEGDEQHSEKRRNRIESGLYREETLSAFQSTMIFSGKYYEPGVVPALWNKIIRRELVQKSAMDVDERIRMGDDAAISYPALMMCRFVIVDNGIDGYHYRTTEGSLSRRYDEKYFDRMERLIFGMREQMKGNELALGQLNYYLLFMLEVGFGQLIARGSGKALSAMMDEIKKESARFSIPGLIGQIDRNTMNRQQQKRIQALERGKNGRYILCRYGETAWNVMRGIFHR